jgi:iron(III) transport system permease protein
MMPIFSFVVLAFSSDYPKDMSFTLANIEKTFRLHADEYLFNSIVIAVLVSLVGVVVAFLAAYLAARMDSRVSKFLHLSSMTSAAIPGVVLGLSYVLAFKGTPVYGTTIILVMVNLVHFISSPYLMIYNSLSKINENLESVAHTMGVKRIHMIKDVFIPMCKDTICEMFSYFFVNCMVTISAVSFLARTANKPIALMINQFEAQSQLESAAVVSLLIMAVNLAVKGTFHVIKQKKIATKA